MTVTLAALQSGLDAAQAVLDAAQGQLENLGADETAVIDIVEFAALLDPALAPAAALAPVVALFINWVAAAHNRSAMPGASTPIAIGGRGSDPWQEHGETGTGT